MPRIVAQITDLHLDERVAIDAGIDSRRNALKILEAIEGRGIKDLVLTGDIGSSGSHRWLLDAIAAHGLEPLFTLGNHDELADFQDLAVVSAFIKPGGLYHSLAMAGVSCIFLDSSRRQIDTEQLSWLEDRLMETEDKVVVFMHHPVLDVGHTAIDRLYPLRNREQVRKIFFESRKRVSIFCGHYHTYHEQSIGKVSQYVTPSALFQIKQRSDAIEMESKSFGYRLIRLSADEIRTEVVICPEV